MIFWIRLISIFLLGYFVANINIPRAEGTERGISWTVPEGVSKIKVISIKDGDQIFNTTINVQPGQMFIVKAVK